MYGMTKLTEVDNLLLKALDTVEWRTRAQIATQVARITDTAPEPLNQYDIQRLEGLVERGHVERSEQQYTRVRKVFIYRLAGE